MKAEERHHLKENELAEALGELPELWHKYGRQVITWAIVVIIAVFAVWYIVHSRRAAHQSRFHQAQQLISEVELLQLQAARRAQAMLGAEEGEMAMLAPYAAGPVAEDLGRIADQSAGQGVGLIARLKQAEALRSQLQFSDSLFDEAQRNALLNQARGLYDQLIADYPQSRIALGAGLIGKGMVAEELGDFDQARQIYEQVLAQADHELAGTIYPRKAQERLNLLPRLSKPVALAPAPAARPASALEYDLGMPTATDQFTGQTPSQAPPSGLLDALDETPTIPAAPVTPAPAESVD